MSELGVLRRLRVTRWPMRRAPARLARHAHFTAAILARHGNAAAQWGELVKSVRHLPALSAIHHRYQTNITRLMLRVEMRLAPAMRDRVEAAPFMPWAPALPATRQASTGPALQTAAHTAMLQRIIARDRNVENVTTMREVLSEVSRAPRDNPKAAPSLLRVPPVEMAVHRARTPVSGAPPAPGAAITEPTVNMPPFTPGAGRAAPSGMQTALGPAALGQITDQVVRMIDRRVVAQRERHGKL